MPSVYAVGNTFDIKCSSVPIQEPNRHERNTLTL